MARKNYTDEFRQRAVDLYESTPGATLKAIAGDLGISRGGLKEWVDKLGSGAGTSGLIPPAAGARPQSQAARIRVPQDPAQGGDRAYGAPRVTADLNDGVAAAERVNHKRVARVMREHRLARIRLRRRVKTTIPDQSARRFPDLIGRDFSIGEPNRRYVGDITSLPIADGSNLYLATCIDLGSRKLAGWQVADHMRVGLVEDALRAAAHDRGSLAGAIFHSDHGSVHASKAYAATASPTLTEAAQPNRHRVHDQGSRPQLETARCVARRIRPSWQLRPPSHLRCAISST